MDRSKKSAPHLGRFLAKNKMKLLAAVGAIALSKTMEVLTLGQFKSLSPNVRHRS